MYPTISRDRGFNSDLTPERGAEEYVVYNQAARYTGACRVFAPVYRQVTLAGLGGTATAEPGVQPGERAYADVLDAFRYYIAHESKGRGFILVGHSQGAGILRRLVAEEIEPEPVLHDRLVAAHLLGTTVAVPAGADDGGSFQRTPLCGRRDQTGCVVTYARFRSESPPPANSRFARTATPGQIAGCVNPANPDAGDRSQPLHPYFLIDVGDAALGTGARPFTDTSRTDEITTPWITYPNFVSAACRTEGDFNFLAVYVAGDPADPRVDNIGGDLTPDWGLHLVDMNVAIGDLVELAKAEGAAYR